MQITKERKKTNNQPKNGGEKKNKMFLKKRDNGRCIKKNAFLQLTKP